MKLWDVPKKLFKAKVPDNLKQYIGRQVTIPQFGTLNGVKTKMGEDRVFIGSICGNKFKQNFYEINGAHLIGMLRFHAQMEKAKDITEDEMQAFEEMEMSAEKMPDQPKEISNG